VLLRALDAAAITPAPVSTKPSTIAEIERFVEGSGWEVAVQFACHPEKGAFCPTKDLGEPRDASRSLRRNNRAFGSLP